MARDVFSIYGLSVGHPAPFIPGYAIEERLGSGAMGVVFRARELVTNRMVALKWIPSDVAPTLRARFEREARAAASLLHPNIVIVYGAGTTAAGHWIAMELIRGEPLATALDLGVLAPRTIAALLGKVARALEVAHAIGIVHRDVKPGNILVDSAGEPRLIDFGLARFLHERSILTGEGNIVGTLPYLSPEMAADGADRAGPPSDIFSLGCVLYEALAGDTPFAADSPMAMLSRLVNGAPFPLSPATPRDLERAVLAFLAKDPSCRPSAGAAAAMLEAASVEPLFARDSRSDPRAWLLVHRMAAALLANESHVANDDGASLASDSLPGRIALALARLARGERVPDLSALVGAVENREDALVLRAVARALSSRARR